MHEVGNRIKISPKNIFVGYDKPGTYVIQYV